MAKVELDDAITNVRPISLTIGLRILDEVVLLCSAAGESAAEIRRRVLMATDRVARGSGAGCCHRATPDPAIISGAIGNVAALLGLLAKKVTPNP